MSITHAPERNLEPAWVADVLRFWFAELGEAHWFARSADVDAQIRRRFLPLHARLTTDGGWAATTPRMLLAAVIVLDQFSRNLHRGTPRAYAADPSARRLARTAVAQGLDTGLTKQELMFLYLPLEHSESTEDQALAVEVISRLGEQEWTRYAMEHKATIDRFGRFPYRNAILGRSSSAEELEALKDRADWWA